MKHLFVYLKGLAMGAADVVPGVSGGTIAFITGIYDTLLASINSFNLEALKVLRTQGFSFFWKHINGTFLVALVAGIFTSILSLAKLFSYLLSNHPIGVWSFFFGLIAASVLYMAGEVKQKNMGVLIAFLAGTAVSYYITIAAPAQGPDTLWYIFICGAIAICAMILPGISGSFILLLMGAYHTVLTAVSELNFKLIITFMLGAVVGLFSFSRLVKYLLDKHRAIAISLLTGFLAGSLNKVWPWKTNILTRTNSKGNVVAYLDENVLPQNYSQVSESDALLGLTQKDPNIVLAIILMIVGFLLVFGMSKVSKKIPA